MSPQSTALPSGLEALKQGRYKEAVELLETFRQLAQVDSEPESKEYLQAQIGLVKAYYYTRQQEKAIALCQQLVASKNPQVQAWAQQFLLNLAPAKTLQAALSQPEVETQVSTESATEAQPAGKTTDVGIKLKTLAELKSFYYRNLFIELKAFETKRKAILKQITVVGIAVLLTVGTLLRFFPIDYIEFSSVNSAKTSFLIIFLFLLAFVGCMWSWVIFYSSSTETYATGFKTKIIQKILDFIDTNKILSYAQYADTHTTLSAFKHSQLFQSLVTPSKISQNDCFFGKIGETDIFFSEICAEVEITHQWLSYLDFTRYIGERNYFRLPIYIYIFGSITRVFKGTPYIIRRIVKGQRIDYYHFEEEVLKNEVSRKSIFKGIFFRANFNKAFKGKTVVLPAVLDYKIQLLNRRRGQAARLEDPEFNKLFVVYGDDQVEARYILSTNLMVKLVRFRKKAGRNIYVSFVESRIYIAIEYAEDLFEPKLFKSMLSFAPIREYFETLQLMLGVVEELNLNRRIWSK